MQYQAKLSKKSLRGLRVITNTPGPHNYTRQISTNGVTPVKLLNPYSEIFFAHKSLNLAYSAPQENLKFL